MDDNATNLALAADVLRLADFEVETATGAEPALAKIAHALPDLILMDLAMPGMDGLTLTRKLKADPATKEIPIIAVTASAMKGDNERVSAAGCDGYITKPIDTRKFAEQVRAYLPIPRPQPAARAKAVLRIMVVDDIEVNRRLLRATLETEGMEVLEAVDGLEALGLLRTSPRNFDVIISDILMPRLDGYRFCQELRADTAFDDLPLIFYSSTYTSAADEKLARDLGADEFIRKPASPRVILDAITCVTGPQRTQRQSPVKTESELAIVKEYSQLLVGKLEQKVNELERLRDELNKANQSLEARVQERTAKLEAANKDLEFFGYSLTHDLNSPLAAATMGIELIRFDQTEAIPPRTAKLIDTTQRSLARMKELIASMLKLAGLTSEPLTLERVDLSSLAELTINELRRTDPERKIEIRIASAIFGYGDRQLLLIVMENLLRNAWKFTSRTESPRIEFTSEVKEGQAIFYVRDNGAGFDTAAAPRLFDAFQRFHSEAQFSGNGIGLATVHRIIERHGGRIWAESKVGHGSTFYFVLPAIKSNGEQ